MKAAVANSIEIAYETFGQPDDPCLLLVMGLGEQMVAWPAEFCRMLADAGFYTPRDLCVKVSRCWRTAAAKSASVKSKCQPWCFMENRIHWPGRYTVKRLPKRCPTPGASWFPIGDTVSIIRNFGRYWWNTW